MTEERPNFYYCCYCGKSLTISMFNFTWEHLLPKSKGGNDTFKNKKPCCKTCNNWRGNQTLEQFYRIVKFHLDRKMGYRELAQYDYKIMLENISYWKDYVDSDTRGILKRKSGLKP